MFNVVLSFACKRFTLQHSKNIFDFILLIHQALPSNILSNVFSRFGSLLDVYMLPNKNCGYAKYANANSAQNAIQKLNGAEVCGVKLKVSNTTAFEI